MRKAIFALAALTLSSGAFAAAPDCSKFNLQISYNDVAPIKDIAAGKIVASTRMYNDRCEKAGQTLDVVFSGDPRNPADNNRRKPQARVLVKKVTPNVAFSALTDAMAQGQGLKTAAELRAFLATIYGKDADGNAVDLSKQPWTHIEFSLAR